MIVWALVAAIVVLLVLVGWLLRRDRGRAAGGTLDLSAAAARGELDLQWDWPVGSDDAYARPGG